MTHYKFAYSIWISIFHLFNHLHVETRHRFSMLLTQTKLSITKSAWSNHFPPTTNRSVDDCLNKMNEHAQFSSSVAHSVYLKLPLFHSALINRHIHKMWNRTGNAVHLSGPLNTKLPNKKKLCWFRFTDMLIFSILNLSWVHTPNNARNNSCRQFSLDAN